MSVYSYPQSKIIDEVTFAKTANGAVRAYLHTRAGVGDAQIQTMLQTLRDGDYECTPFSLDGKPTLEVRGFKNEKQLTNTLEQENWVTGKPTIQAPQEKISLWEKFKKRTLQLSGLSYAFGDYKFFSYGRKEADKLVMAGAFSYFLGTLSLVFYGRNDQSDIQVRDLAKDLEGFLKKENITLPESSALHQIAKEKDKTLVKSMHEFCKRYPSEIFNSVTALAGVFVASSAYRNKIRFKPKPGMDLKAIQEMHHEGFLDFGLGSLTAVSGIFGTLVKEKKPDPDDPPAKGFARIKQFIQAHPLAIAGGGYTISTLFHAASTWKAFKEAKRVNDKLRLASVPERAGFVGAGLLAELLLAFSSKGHGEGVVSDKSVDTSVIALAADMIVKQPADSQEVLIEHVTKFLGDAKELAMKDEEVKATLRTQVEALRKNPWAMTPEKNVVALPAKTSPNWQTKIAVESPAPQLSA